jgi:MFS family permease
MFGHRAFTLGVLTTLVFYAGMGSFFLVLALYLQEGHGLSALASGAIFTPLAIGFFATSMSAPRFTPRLGRQALAVGALVLGAGQMLLAVSVAEIGGSGPITLLIPAMVVGGAGMGMVIAPLTAGVLAGVAPRHIGAASGVLNTAVQIGGALGVALIGVIFYGALGRIGSPIAYSHAFSATLIYLIILAFAVAVLVQFMPRERQANTSPSQSADDDRVESKSDPTTEPVGSASRESAA